MNNSNSTFKDMSAEVFALSITKLLLTIKKKDNNNYATNHFFCFIKQTLQIKFKLDHIQESKNLIIVLVLLLYLSFHLAKSFSYIFFYLCTREIEIYS